MWGYKDIKNIVIGFCRQEKPETKTSDKEEKEKDNQALSETNNSVNWESIIVIVLSFSSRYRKKNKAKRRNRSQMSRWEIAYFFQKVPVKLEIYKHNTRSLKKHRN